MEDETDNDVVLTMLDSGEENHCSAIYNRAGQVAIVVGDMAIITMSPYSAAILSGLLRDAARAALTDLSESLGAK